jgi:sec-independent protein translocase protein TatA
MFSGADAPWHWLILIVLVVALFGYKKLPDAARSLGRSMRIFKTEIKGMTEDDAVRDAHKVAPVATAANLVKNTPVVEAVPTAEQPATPTVSAPPATTSDAGSAQSTTPGTV